MLTIRDSQMRAFELAGEQRFEDEMVRHCVDFSPKLCAVLGEAQLRIAVRHAVARARGCGLTCRGSIRLFIELSFLYGCTFDTDPQYPWAGRALDESGAEMNRAERLHERALEYQANVSGPGAANTRNALVALKALAEDSVSLSDDTFLETMRRETTRVFPQKVASLDPDALDTLIGEGRDAARQYGFPIRGQAMVVALMFAFGHGCLSDPLYPWIGGTLADDRIVSPKARAERLEKKATTWLRHVVASPTSDTHAP